MKTYQNVRPQYVAPIDLQTLNTAYANLESMHQQAVQTSSELKNAIAQLQLNESEEPFRQQLVKNIEDTISTNIQYGNLASAYDDIVKLSGDIVANPALIGRLKAQQEYLTYKNKIEASNIPEQYKDNFKALNPYYYQDIYDDKGNIVGGTKWEPNKLPVNKVDYNALMTKALQYVTPKNNTNQIMRFMKADGTFTTKLEPGVQAVWYDAVTSQIEEVTKEQIYEALDSAIQADPGALASLHQDFEMAKMDYEKGIDPIHKIFNGTRTYTFHEFVDNIFNPMVHAKAYKHTSSSSEYNKNFYKEYATVFGGNNNNTESNTIGITGVKTSQNSPLVEIEDITGIQSIYGVDEANKLLREHARAYSYNMEIPYIDIMDPNTVQQFLNDPNAFPDEESKQLFYDKYLELLTIYSDEIYNLGLMNDDDINTTAIAATKVRADILSGETYDPNSPTYKAPKNKAEELERQRWISLQNDFFPNNSEEMKIVFHQDKSKKAFEQYLKNNCPEIFISKNGSSKALSYTKDGILINKEFFGKYIFQLAKAIEAANNSINMFQRNVDMGYIDDNGNFIDYTSSANPGYSTGIGKGNYESKQLVKRINDFNYGLISRSGQANMGGGESIYLQAMSAPGANVADLLANWQIQDANILDSDTLTHINKTATTSGNIHERVLYEALIANPEQSLIYMEEDGVYHKKDASENQDIIDEIFSNTSISNPTISYEFMWDQMRWIPKITYVDRKNEEQKGKVKSIIYDFGKNSAIDEVLNSDPTLSANKDFNISKNNGKPIMLISPSITPTSTAFGLVATPTPAGDFVLHWQNSPDNIKNIIKNGDEIGYNALLQLRTTQKQLHSIYGMSSIDINIIGNMFNNYVNAVRTLLGNDYKIRLIERMFENESGFDIEIDYSMYETNN